MRALKICAAYGREHGVSLPHSRLGGYKMPGLVEEILLTVQHLIPSLGLYAPFPRHQSQDRHIPSAHIPFSSNKQHDLYHDERSAKYPLEVFDRCFLCHRGIRSVIELGRMEKIFTQMLLCRFIALPQDTGMLQNTGVQLGCTENCNDYYQVVSHRISNPVSVGTYLSHSWRQIITAPGWNTPPTGVVRCRLPPAWDSWRCSSGPCSACCKLPMRVMRS